MWPHGLRSVSASQEPTAEDKVWCHHLCSWVHRRRSTPECVSGRPCDRDDPDQDSAPQERKTLLLKPRWGPVEQNKEAAAVPKSPQPAPKASSILADRDSLTRLPESLRSKHG
ncbi:hypothetical protein HPB52_019141 [Rhipicephalus sanguineus]|uniref:Uncharacterized protein n=1 Tax=Rhipicephalus sanguineus TaxID=34632 RepID=A0A9D4PGS5_RHISA|nr:hypothetical protein HPB52_019141 [Rhipicephalus sanguineus]